MTTQISSCNDLFTGKLTVKCTPSKQNAYRGFAASNENNFSGTGFSGPDKSLPQLSVLKIVRNKRSDHLLLRKTKQGLSRRISSFDASSSIDNADRGRSGRITCGYQSFISEAFNPSCNLVDNEPGGIQFFRSKCTFSLVLNIEDGANFAAYHDGDGEFRQGRAVNLAEYFRKVRISSYITDVYSRAMLVDMPKDTLIRALFISLW